jgi:hypothetical protein
MLDIIASMAAPLVRETLFAFAVRAAAVVAASDFTVIGISLLLLVTMKEPAFEGRGGGVV